jgi:hypothetical protein
VGVKPRDGKCQINTRKKWGTNYTARR